MNETVIEKIQAIVASGPNSSSPSEQEFVWNRYIVFPWEEPGYDAWVELVDALVGSAECPIEFLQESESGLDACWPSGCRHVLPNAVEAFFAAEDPPVWTRLFRSLDMKFSGVSLEVLASAPAMSYIHQLRIDIDFGDEEWRQIASNKHLGAVSRLSLVGGEEEAVTLVEEALLGGLTFLDLSACGLRDSEAKRLAASPNIDRLVHLDLGQDADRGPNMLSTVGVRALADRLPASLEYLDFSGSEAIDDAAVQALAESAFAPNLRQLHLVGIGLGEDGLRALEAFPKLEVLTLGNLAESSLRFLGDVDGLTMLRGLFFWGRNEISDAAAASFRRAKPSVTALKY